MSRKKSPKTLQEIAAAKAAKAPKLSAERRERLRVLLGGGSR